MNTVIFKRLIIAIQIIIVGKSIAFQANAQTTVTWKKYKLYIEPYINFIAMSRTKLSGKFAAGSYMIWLSMAPKSRSTLMFDSAHF